MKKLILGVIALIGLFGVSFSYAVNTYSTQEAFEKAEGKTCKSATDGCNTFFMNNGKVGGGTLMMCADKKVEWSCKLKKITSKEEFIKKYGHTCETATDGVNTFFGKDFMASTRMGYPKDFVADWSCKKEKESTLSENDANHLKHLTKILDKKLKAKVDSALSKYEKKIQKLKNPQEANNKIIEKVGDTIFSKIIMKYPQDSALPKKASDLYNTLEYLKLSLMNIDFDEKNTVKIANPASEFCVKQGGALEIKDEKNGQVGYCKLKDGKVVEEWKYFRENSKK